MTEEIKKPNRQELIDMLKMMNEDIEKLPVYAMSSPVMQYDLSALIILLHAIFKAEN